MKRSLIVIDMQRYFLDPRAPAYLESAPGIVGNILTLIDAFRNSGLPIFYTRHAHNIGEPTEQMGKWWNDKLPWNNSWESEIIDEIKPKAGEPVITKTKYSALEGTKLEEWLVEQDTDEVVLCGVTTNLCVETTARHAFIRNFQPIVVEDAVAAKSDGYHRASILNLSYGFARIENTESIVRLLQEEIA
jgi:ureidoacrylate peracid hydrolase